MLWIDIKYAKLVSTRLQRYKVKKDDGRTYLSHFRCNICGDSQTSEKKTRGNFYSYDGSLFMGCYNCGARLPFGKWLKGFDNNLYRQYVMEKFGKKEENVKPVIEQSNTKLLNIFDDLDSINELPATHPALRYIEQRKIPKRFWDQLHYAPKFISWAKQHTDKFDVVQNAKDHPRLIIPWLNKDGECFAYQARAFDPKDPHKYYSITLDSSQPRVYGLDRLKASEQVYVVEGQIDSMFLPNCVAVGNATLYTYENKDAIYVPDNEPRNKEIVKIIGKMINMGLKVCLLPPNWKYKDINEAIQNNLTEEQILAIINKNVVQGLSGQMIFNMWRRV